MAAALGGAAGAEGPRLFVGDFSVEEAADTWVTLGAGWTKGSVVVNGRDLGRYWGGGARTAALYLPAPFLRAGNNQVLVLELQPGAGLVQNASMLLVGEPVV